MLDISEEKIIHGIESFELTKKRMDITELENHICNKLVELEKLLSDENYDYAEVNDKYIRIYNLLEEREAMLKHY